MSELADLTQEAAGWALLAAAAKERAEDARERLQTAMQAAGSLKQEAPGLGLVNVTGGKDGSEVYDLEALTAWTVQHRPDQIQPAVRPTWIRLMLEIARKEGQAFDPETGAVVPGVRRVTTQRGLRITTDRVAREGARLLLQEMHTGQIKLTTGGDDHGTDS